MTTVIVGAGHAGFQGAATLRQRGYEGAITLVAGELGLPLGGRRPAFTVPRRNATLPGVRIVRERRT